MVTVERWNSTVDMTGDREFSWTLNDLSKAITRLSYSFDDQENYSPLTSLLVSLYDQHII